MVRVQSEDGLTNLVQKNHLKGNGRVINVFVYFSYIIIALGMCAILPQEQLATTLFYNAVILTAVLLAAMAERTRTQVGFNILFFLSFLVLFFTLGFRDFSGIDDPAYIKIFNNVVQYGWLSVFKSTTMEPGYLLLNYGVSLLTGDYFCMQFITSFIPLFLFYLGFRKYRNVMSMSMAVFLLSTMIYFQMLAVSLVRMFIALSIVFNAMYYVPQRDTKKYISLVLLASTFHYSALFMLVLTYFSLNQKNLSNKAKRFVALGFAGTPVAFVIIAQYLVPRMGVRYSGYGSLGSLELSLGSFDTLPLLVLLLLNYKRIDAYQVEFFKLFVSTFALSSIISFYSSMVSLGRLIFYANSAFFVAAPMVSRALNNDYSKVLFCVLIIMYGFLYLYRTQFCLDAHIPFLFPYRNLFFTI